MIKCRIPRSVRELGYAGLKKYETLPLKVQSE